MTDVDAARSKDEMQQVHRVLNKKKAFVILLAN